MKTVHQQITQVFKAIRTLAGSLCDDQMLWSFNYSNEPKQGHSWSGFSIS